MEEFGEYINIDPYIIAVYELRDISGWNTPEYEPNYNPTNMARYEYREYEDVDEWSKAIVSFVIRKDVRKIMKGISTCVLICAAN